MLLVLATIRATSQIWTEDFEENGLGITYTSPSVFTSNLNGHYNRTNGSTISNTVAAYTGGLTNKRYGRIGDSPLIGSGTYADNQTCAVSCTGKGEDFIRLNVAHDISSLILYKGITLDSAVNEVIHRKLKAIKGRGGCIAINRNGNISMAFTTSGMYRGSIDTEGKMEISIYAD